MKMNERKKEIGRVKIRSNNVQQYNKNYIRSCLWFLVGLLFLLTSHQRLRIEIIRRRIIRKKCLIAFERDISSHKKINSIKSI